MNACSWLVHLVNSPSGVPPEYWVLKDDQGNAQPWQDYTQPIGVGNNWTLTAVYSVAVCGETWDFFNSTTKDQYGNQREKDYSIGPGSYGRTLKFHMDCDLSLFTIEPISEIPCPPPSPQ
jgi:hypothetical protein